MGATTSPLDELSAAANAAEALTVRAEFDLPGGGSVSADFTMPPARSGFTGCGLLTEQTGKQGRVIPIVTVKDLRRAFAEVTTRYANAVIRPDTVALTVRGGPTPTVKLKPVAVQAWYEAFGLLIPTLDELKARKKATKAAKQGAAAELVELLRAGPEGVAKFNKLSAADRAKADLRKADFAGLDLSGAKFHGADLSGADLSGCTLRNAEFINGRTGQHSAMKAARLVDADLTGVKLVAVCTDADFTRAKLAGAQLTWIKLTRADFTHADLTDADLSQAQLSGTNFTGATLTGAKFDQAVFDHETKWPKKFKLPTELIWKGGGPDPRLAPTLFEKRLPPPSDFGGFMARLEKVTDVAKLKKATSMLKADRFRLFAKVTDDHLVGVVKSQSDGELVYSCRLSSGGDYGCCTQNLNVCGGLRGSPCKHLLVLIVGLTKAGELDPAIAHAWTQASRGKKFALDKDAMTETLLQYKGAEAGEVDWRPTETIPEDFYAM